MWPSSVIERVASPASRFQTSPLYLRKTEVEDFDPTFVGQHDIGRFEISMRDPALVRGGDRIGEWDGDVEERAEGEARFRQPLSERAPSYELHRDEVQAVGFFDGMHRHDVGVIERRDGFGFPRKSDATRGVNGQLRRQDFQGDLTIESGVFRQIDLAHPTGANRLDDPVVGDGLADHEGGSAVLLRGGERIERRVRESVSTALTFEQ